jgi:phthiocerol/phenolphthiocerol synthesis type-I polyketide synthase E
MSNNQQQAEPLEGVAVIGMAGRFPKADNIEQYWKNLISGKECISFYTEEELIEAGNDAGAVRHPDYVRAKGEVGNVDRFDAEFFGINPREAEVTDPQHRMLLECAWEAMEHAGYDSGKYGGLIGVYAGKSMDYYLLLNVYPQIRREISAGSLQAAIGNDKDSLTTTISYRLNLTGPAITVQTSSSTSLVAVCVAAQSLLTYQCDIALAGGITAGPPIKSGYRYQDGGIWARDGHCRSFDAGSTGFVPGSGMGMVVLKRLEDAVADGDTVWAVIKGYAVNNDGANKVSYSAPSVDAQSQVVAQAQAMAAVHPETIQYIETHGTGTILGDPIEITALTQAFRAQTEKKRFCAVGSVKSNIGHLDNAAGVAGLIKAAQALKYKMIPPTLHFETPNPKIDFENSPFYVNTELMEWQGPADGIPRRAGVTSLGMGGTNAHVVLEEAPAVRKAGKEGRELQLLMLSSRTPTALETMTGNLAEYLREHPGIDIRDVAYTLQRGRRDFDYRRAVMSREPGEALENLEQKTPGRVFDGTVDTSAVGHRPVVFMFSGQGSQYVNMGRELYRTEPVYREHIDSCAEILEPELGLDIRQLIYPAEGEEEQKAGQLRQTRYTQPVLLSVELALARLWQDWGVHPEAMIGHSIGEYAAAVIAGVMEPADALRLVAARGRMMQEMTEGGMLSVGLPEPDITAVLRDNPAYRPLSIAALNSPKSSVVSGPADVLEQLETELTQQGHYCRRLHTSHAFHSSMMEPMLKAFEEEVANVPLDKPEIPFISGVTGTWITDGEARSPQYWAQQLRQPVRFSSGLQAIREKMEPVYLEVGPGNSLCQLAKQQDIPGGVENEDKIQGTLRHIKQSDTDIEFIHRTQAKLWLNGVSMDWESYYRNENRTRIPLPTYPFERKRYWLESIKEAALQSVQAVQVETGEQGKQGTAEKEENPAAKVEPGDKPAKSYQPRPKLNTEYVASTDPVEKQLVDIWEEILGLQPVGINDSFFDLGGHSLLATLFLSRVQEIFQVRLELRIIFETPTIATIAQQIKEEQQKAAGEGDIENLLDEIEGMSEEELNAALEKEQ